MDQCRFWGYFLIRGKKCASPNGSNPIFVPKVYGGLVKVESEVKWVENMLFDGVFR
jgi:hypothetical protein